MKNIKNQAERMALERTQSQQAMEKEQETLREQIRETEERIYRVQTNKNKEMTNLK